jgi:hypothetical protein
VIHISMNTYTYGKGITASYDVEWKFLICIYLNMVYYERPN